MSKYMSWIAKTFANPEELMIALLQGEKWKYSGTVFSYRDFKFYAGSMLINSLQSMEILCDNKTLWTKVEDKTELDLMKEKYAGGDYIIICKNPNPIANQTSTWFLHQESHLGAYKPFEADHLQHKLIHKNHKDILDAYLADNSVSITWGLGGVVSTGEAFIKEYDESFEYRLKPKKKTVSLALFTCYDLTFKRWCTPYINESLEDYKTFFDSESYINHHEIPETRYEMEIDE